MKTKKIDIGTIMIMLGVLIMAVSIVFYIKIKYDESAQKRMMIEEQEKFKANLEARKNQKPSIADDYDVYNKHRETPSVESNVIVEFEEEEEAPVYTVSTEGAVGFVEIPKLDLILPLHPGTSNQSLNKGVGIMSEFDMPSDGRNSMSVIASHRGGRRGENTFLRVDKLHAGDRVKVLTDSGEIEYTVSKKEVVVPTDWSKFVRDKNKATLVLLTCDPYPTNENRLLVFCERVYEPIEEETPIEEEKPVEEEKPQEGEQPTGADQPAQDGASQGEQPADEQNPAKEQKPDSVTQTEEEADEEDPNADQQEMNKNPEDVTLPNSNGQ